MNLKLFFLSSFIYASLTITYADDISTGKGGLGGGLGVSNRMLLFSTLSTDVHIIDSSTGLELAVVLVEELDFVIDSLPSEEYILIYTDSEGRVTEEIPLFKE